MLDGMVTMSFGGLKALDEVEFSVQEESICGLIGPNGSGKTTLFNCINGILRPQGYIKFLGVDIIKLKPHEIFSLGIGRTYQIPMPFTTMSVLENVMVGILFKRRHLSIKDAKSEAVHFLDFLGLANKANLNASLLNMVERKKLEIARALVSEPRIVLLDEPLSGLSESELRKSCETIRRIRDELGITIFWVEHVMRALMKSVEKVIVLDHGKKIAEGPPDVVARERCVIAAYLGENVNA